MGPLPVYAEESSRSWAELESTTPALDERSPPFRQRFDGRAPVRIRRPAVVRSRGRPRPSAGALPRAPPGARGRGGRRGSRLERPSALRSLTTPVPSVARGRRTRFRRGGEIVSRLDHPGICTILDADLD